MKSKPLEEINKLKKAGFYLYKISWDNTVHYKNKQGTTFAFQLRTREINKLMKEEHTEWAN